MASQEFVNFGPGLLKLRGYVHAPNNLCQHDSPSSFAADVYQTKRMGWRDLRGTVEGLDPGLGPLRAGGFAVQDPVPPPFPKLTNAFRRDDHPLQLEDEPSPFNGARIVGDLDHPS